MAILSVADDSIIPVGVLFIFFRLQLFSR
ncbi:Uncharacterized protein APZ42_026077 [Daphnia magna]|uniref:Uncharacterized protein n=1 Tax=Daphnia magna TaxID=35525 RepID=A0A164SIU2_9CRUS|nr:Uncharacterized protein APZ42_026077 [Daphnia magna]